MTMPSILWPAVRRVRSRIRSRIACRLLPRSGCCFRPRHLSASPPHYPTESGSLPYGPPVLLRLLSTPPRGDAVAFGCGALADSGTEFRPAGQAPSGAHCERLQARAAAEPGTRLRQPLSGRLSGLLTSAQTTGRNLPLPLSQPPRHLASAPRHSAAGAMPPGRAPLSPESPVAAEAAPTGVPAAGPPGWRKSPGQILGFFSHLAARHLRGQTRPADRQEAVAGILPRGGRARSADAGLRGGSGLVDLAARSVISRATTRPRVRAWASCRWKRRRSRGKVRWS